MTVRGCCGSFLPSPSSAEVWAVCKFAICRLAMPTSADDVDDPSDCLRVLLATDIHLGYKEKDANRAADSFDTFEEILGIARDQRVDMLLLGGDLFHENKPTRDAEKRCLDLLQRHVLGDGAVQVTKDLL